MIVGAEAAWAIIIMAAFWVALAVLLAIVAARRIRRAQAVVGSARTLKSLLEAAPARAMLVHGDGKVEADPQLGAHVEHLQRRFGEDGLLKLGHEEPEH